jgi:hypothetical protein
MKKVEPRPEYSMIVTVHSILQSVDSRAEATLEMRRAPSVAGGALVKIVV